MAEAALTRQDTGDSFTPDVVVSLGYSRSAKISEHPVEDGSSIADHSQSGNLPISMTAIVTESPYARRGEFGGVARIRAARDWLESAMLAGDLLTLTSKRMGSTSNCLIKRLQWPVTVERKVTFTIELVQITIATSTSIVISESAVAESEDSAYSFADEVDIGEQATSTTEGDEAAEEGDKSALAALWDSIG